MALINKKQEYQDQEDWSNDVQKLKGYKELVEKVEYWAKQKDLDGFPVIDGSYEIVYDNELGWCVDVNGAVDFSGSEIKEIPFQFRNVSCLFSCEECRNLTSLKGCPIYVGNSFSCSYCRNLTSLEGSPLKIHNFFYCFECENLTSLKGCPKEVGNNIYCYDCGKEFTKEYVQSLCDVKGIIFN